jgi:O-antigen/teichoic acid export membrane protein
VGILLLDPTIGGYALGRLGAAALSAVLTVGLSLYLWRKHDRLPIFSWQHLRQGLPAFRANFRFIFLNNFLGYAKLLHRSGDVLLVGFFTNDLLTGWYKLARTLTDALYLLYDSINKVYQPFFLQQLAANILGDYRLKAKKLLLFSGLFTIAMLVGEILLLPQFIAIVFGPKFLGAASTIIILTLPFFFVNGLFIWIWPVYLYTGKIKQYVVINLVAVITGQYGLSVLLYVLTGRHNVAWFAVGYVASYIIQCPGIYRFLTRECPFVLPWQAR